MDINNLYNAALAGDHTAKEHLFEHLTARFRYFAQLKIDNSMDAEEIVQNSLLVVYDKYADIDIKSSFSGWAHTILNNKIKEFYRTRATHKSKLDEYGRQTVNPESPESMAHLERQLKDCLRKINEINQRHARILNLSYQGYSVDDICEKFNLTRSNLYSVLSRARSLLSECLKKGELAK